MTLNTLLTPSDENVIDLGQESSPANKERAMLTASMATMASQAIGASDSLEATGQQYNRFRDKISSGGEDDVRAELASMKKDEVTQIANDLQETALINGDTSAVKEAIDNSLTFDTEAAKDTVIETEAARQMVDSGLKDSDRTSIAIKGITETDNTLSYEDISQDILSESLFTSKQVEDRLDKLGWNLDTAVDAGALLIPGFTTWFHSQNVATAINPWLAGNDIAEQKATWDTMSLEEKSKAAKGINEFFDNTGSHLNGLIYWAYMGNLTDLDVFLENTGSVLDATVLGGTLSKIFKLPKIISLISKGRTASVSLEVGNRADAAAQVEAVTAGIEVGEISRTSEVALEAAELSVDKQLLPTADGLVGLSGRLKEQINSVEKLTDDFTSVQTNAILDTAERENLLNAAREETIFRASEEGKIPADIAIFREDKLVKDIVGNFFYRVYYGAEGGKGFPSEESARKAAESLKISDASVTPLEQNGTYFIQMDRRLEKQGDYILAYDKENLDSAGGLRRVMASTTNMVALSEAKAAHLSLATRETTTKIGKELIKNVRKLSKDKKLHVAEVMEDGRNRQKWFSFEELRRIGLDDDQVAAYHSMRRMDDIEYLIDNSLRFGRLEREGFKSVELKSEFAVAKELGEFNAKPLDTIPNPENKSVFDATSGKYLHNPSSKDIEAFKDKGFQIFSLEGATQTSKHPVQFILAKKQDLVVKSLNPRQIEYLPGGRLHYAEEFYVKQGRLRNGPGSVPIMLTPKTYGVASEAEAIKYTNEMEAGRQLVLKEGSDVELAAATGGRYTSVEEYIKFVGEKNLNMPFEVVKDGHSLTSVNDVVQSGKASAMAEDLNMGNSIQRMLRTRGSKTSKRGDRMTDYTGDVAPVVNPIKSATQSLDRAVNLISLETWKDKQLTKFSKTFNSVLEGDKTPLMHFLNPEFKAVASAGDKKLVRQAKVMQEHYKKILNTKTKDEVWIDEIISDVVDKVAPRLNASAEAKKAVKDFDPIAFARFVTFQAKLGLMNLSQPFVQLQTSILMSTASLQGPKAVLMSPHIRMMLLSDNPDTLGLLAKAFSVVSPGTDSKTMKEALEVVKRSGTWRLEAGSLAEQDLIKTSGSAGYGSKLLEIGITPFIESERFNKIAGTTAAYLEWRKVNKTATITDDVIDGIRTRGEQLVASMNRVDQAAWQRGIAGTLTQFWGYQARNIEMWLPQMLGGSKTFTTAEKFRIGLGQLALYGVEGTVGVGTGLSLKEWIRDTYRENFDEEINNATLETISDGFVDRMILTTLGLDVNTHYRTGLGLTESGWGEVVTNLATMQWDKLLTIESAPFSTIPETLKGIFNIARTLSAVNTDLVTPEGFKVAAESVKEAMRKNISSYSRAERAYLAMKTGNYYDSLLHVKARNLSTWEAVGPIWGFDPAEAIDFRSMELAIRSHDGLNDKHVKTLTRAFKEAAINKEPQQFDYIKELVLSSVDNEKDRIDIMRKVLNGIKDKSIKIRFFKAFGPEFLNDKQGVE